MITLQSFLESFRIIVTSLNERFSGDIILHRDFGRMVYEMIGAARGRMDETTRNSRYQKRVRDTQLYKRISDLPKEQRVWDTNCMIQIGMF